MKHTLQTAVKIEPGEIYSYTNKYGYTTIFKVSRITDKSVFHFNLLSDGNFSETEARESINVILKNIYTKIN